MIRLQAYAQALGAQMQQAQVASARLWPNTRVATMQVVMAATVERIDASGTLALRIGRPPRGKASVHELCIEVPGNGNDAISIRLDGHLLGHYGSNGDDQTQ